MSDLIKLEARPVWTIIRFPGDMNNYNKAKILGDLQEVLRAKPDGYRHMPRYKSRQWDGWISLIKRNKFPTGLLHIATEKLDELAPLMEFDYKIKHTHIPSVDTHSITTGIKILHGRDRLRDYQRDAIRILAKEKRGVAHMATNAGKTYIMAALINLIGGRALIVVHGKELLYQIAGVMREQTSGMTVGLIGDGHMDLDKDVTVATVQTLSSKVDEFEFSEFFRQLDILMIDEVHHASARTVYETVMKIPAIFRYGFSGTPLKNNVLNDLQLMATTGPIVVRVSNEELIEAGHSATPEITMYRINGVRDDSLKYQEAYRELIVRNGNRNIRIAKEAIKLAQEGGVVLVLVNRIDHQRYIASNIIVLGYSNYTMINGKHSTRTRQDVLERMRNGRAGVYIATGIFGEGVDIPSVDALIIAGAGKSHIRLLQQVGRGLRKKAGENRVTIIDFIDTANKYLVKHANKRKKIYQEEGFTVEVV